MGILGVPKNGSGCGCCSGGGGAACSPCNLPGSNLTLSYTNLFIGNGSATLVYTGAGPSWASACTNGLLYELACNGGSVELRVVYFTTGACPTGTQQYCSNLRASPQKLTLASSTCSPLSLTFTSSSSSCPVITGSGGYTQFVVTYP